MGMNASANASMKTAAETATERLLSEGLWNEALHRITPGLLHDLNNCLAGMLSISETCLLLSREEHSLHEDLTLMKHSSHRAGHISGLLMHLHREKSGPPGYHDLNHIAAENVDLLGRVLKRKLDLQLLLAPGPLPVLADSHGLRKCLIFLAFNIAQSIQSRGRLIFKTCTHVTLSPPTHFRGNWPKAPCVELSISGHGGQLFQNLEHFFDCTLTGDREMDRFRLRLAETTREAQAAGGAVAVQASLESGNTFQLLLPKADLDQSDPAA